MLMFRRLMSTSGASSGRMLGQVCVVTGGGGGIGRETALLLAENGADGVVVADVDEEQGSKTVEMIEKHFGSGKAVFKRTDVSQSSQVKDMIDLAETQYGKLTFLFNNAGIMHSNDDDAVNTPDDVWDLTMDINVKGVLYGCKYGIPAMKRAGGGSIVNTASFVASIGAATPQLAYTASKGAVLAMTRELAVLHARQNIRVNSLCPGPLNTPLLQKFLDSEEKRQRRLVHIPMGRFGEAKEMANAVLFLASKESSYVTGASLAVDAGITSAYVTPEEVVDPFGGPL
mmetsp:Transcript_8434/g.13678  ORF Transcript_8434/g.13678 Transcript_8434/m.13678 type:complete len:286 (+) Transcript_8434:113-970(+)